MLVRIPAGLTAAPCKACGKDVYRVRTPDGTKALIDSDVPGGVEPSDDHDGYGVSHFETCPTADRFGKPKTTEATTNG